MKIHCEFFASKDLINGHLYQERLTNYLASFILLPLILTYLLWTFLGGIYFHFEESNHE